MEERDDTTVRPPLPHPDLHYRRILLKLSGEALSGAGAGGIDPGVMGLMARELTELYHLGVQVGVVVGGGNIFRGLKGAAAGMERAQSDYMGMLATVINALALQDALERQGVPTRVMTALEMRQVAEPYIRRRAIRHLDRGNLIIFAAGTGNPYFSTDTAAALRATEIGAQALFKATKVDGIYDKDPVRFSDAKKIHRMTYQQFIEQRIGVMDATAVTLCRENRMPIRVFKLLADIDSQNPNAPPQGNIKRVCLGEDLGTVVADHEPIPGPPHSRA